MPSFESECQHLWHLRRVRQARISNLNTIVMPQLRRAAACGRMQAPHRRVDEVADAGHKHARYERLHHQQQDAGVNRELLGDAANLGRSKIVEAIEIATRGYSL